MVPRCRLQIETNYGATLLRFGVLPFLELRLGTDLLNHRSKSPGGAQRDEFGMSPIGFGFKAALLPEKEIRPKVAFITGWRIPR